MSSGIIRTATVLLTLLILVVNDSSAADIRQFGAVGDGQADDTVAMPLTLHFARVVSAQDLADIEVVVYYDGVRAKGVVVPYQGDEPGDSANGCLAWVGLTPPAPGVQVEVDWRLPARMLGGDEVFEPAVFYAPKVE